MLFFTEVWKSIDSSVLRYFVRLRYSFFFPRRLLPLLTRIPSPALRLMYRLSPPLRRVLRCNFSSFLPDDPAHLRIHDVFRPRTAFPPPSPAMAPDFFRGFSRNHRSWIFLFTLPSAAQAMLRILVPNSPFPLWSKTRVEGPRRKPLFLKLLASLR